jgi:hypothetical protein
MIGTKERRPLSGWWYYTIAQREPQHITVDEWRKLEQANPDLKYEWYCQVNDLKSLFSAHSGEYPPVFCPLFGRDDAKKCEGHEPLAKNHWLPCIQ